MSWYQAVQLVQVCVENNNDTSELPVVGEGSDVDSMPELEDETNLDFLSKSLCG